MKCDGFQNIVAQNMKLKLITRFLLLHLSWGLITQFSFGQAFYNLNFQQLCDSSETGLCHWGRSWGGSDCCFTRSIEHNQVLAIAGKLATSVGFVEQSSMIQGVRGLQIVQVSAKISSEKVEGKGAGLNVSVYDAAANLLFTKDMGYASVRWLQGTHGWKEYSISAICPEGSARIKIGAILYGKGEARFDDYKVSLLPIASRKPSSLATEYITAACETIAVHSLQRDSINILAFKESALAIAGPASDYSECHLAVEYILESLGDHHSFFMTPSEVAAWQNDTTTNANLHFAESRIVNECGYVSVPPFNGGNPNLMAAYSDTLQACLKRLDDAKVKGWIIDLRENTGGNMAPMITGLGPLFDSEKLGSLIDINNHIESWFYTEGKYKWENEIVMNVSNPVGLGTQRPIAVLIGSHTGSSGEAVLISFIGNKKTRSFGQPTWGLTSGNGSFDLRDGARMMLASTIMSDRAGKRYRGPIEPDQKIESDGNSFDDPVLSAAVRWIAERY
jgi:Peptidase family S41